MDIMTSRENPEGAQPGDKNPDIPEGFETILEGKSPEEQTEILAAIAADAELLKPTGGERPGLNKQEIIEHSIGYCNLYIEIWSKIIGLNHTSIRQCESEGDQQAGEIEDIKQQIIDHTKELEKWEKIKKEIERGETENLLIEIERSIETHTETLSSWAKKIADASHDTPDEEIAEFRVELIKAASRLADASEHKRLLRFMREQKVK